MSEFPRCIYFYEKYAGTWILVKTPGEARAISWKRRSTSSGDSARNSLTYYKETNMAIIQLTDIHLDATYNGKFPTMEHFDRVIQDIRTRRSESLLKDDVIIITGDICDGEDKYYYDIVFDMMHRAFPETPVFVTPGNHDDRRVLGLIATEEQKRNKGLGMEFEVAGCVENPGTHGVKFSHNGHNICIVDTGNAAKDTDNQYVHFEFGEDAPVDDRQWLLFTHMPLVAVPHRFMQREGFCMTSNNTVYRALDSIEAVFCGHYHHAHVTKKDDYVQERGPYTYHGKAKVGQYVCPAIQCQLDPYSEECSPSGVFPGYQVIHCMADSRKYEVEVRLLY